MQTPGAARSMLGSSDWPQQHVSATPGVHGGRRRLGMWPGCYGTETNKMEEGKRSGAHRGCDGGLGELGEAPEPTNLTKMAGGPEVEEDIEGGVAARLGPRGSLRR